MTLGFRLWIARKRANHLKERALRKLMPSRMRFVHYDWPLRPQDCPCDVHFCDWLQARDIRRRSIFHFGSGDHHVVGIRNHERGWENDVLALTAAPGEQASYVRRIIHTPTLGRHYKLLFADIYDLSAALLPPFDVVTLFHLCEFTDAASTWRRLDDAGVLDLLLSKLAPGGRMLFYAGSFGYKRTVPLVERAQAAGRLTFVEEYESLRVYRGPAS